jgi:hypothetical protein
MATMYAPNLTTVYRGASDDGSRPLPLGMDFFVFGVNYGNGSNGGVVLNDNAFVSFGYNATQKSGFNASQPGIVLLLGAADRLLLHASCTPVTSVGRLGLDYVACVLRFNANATAAASVWVDFEVTFARDATYQYIEVRAGKSVTYGGTSGTWGLSDAFRMGANLTALVANQSVVLQSDPAGRYWNTFAGRHLDIRLPDSAFSGNGELERASSVVLHF